MPIIIVNQGVSRLYSNRRLTNNWGRGQVGGKIKFFIALCALLALPAKGWAAPDLRVEKIRYGGGGGTTRIVFDLSRKSDFRVFALGDPYRIVVDLPAADWNTSRSQMLTTHPMIKAYRSGELSDGLTRVIFDIKKPASINNAFIVDKDSMNMDRLVIDLTSSSANAFEAQKGRVYGNRGLKGTGAAPAPKQTPAGYSGIQQKKIQEASPDAPPKKPDPNALPKPKKYTVVIDPGHGGGDPGATGHGVQEKFITLQVAKELQRQLEETGRYKVVLTRDRDHYIKLYERVDISRNVKADLFVSIHADKIERKGVRGASIYTLSEKGSDAEAERLAQDENNAGFVAGVDLSQESQEVADILLDLAMREKMNESNLFARMLEDAFRRKSVRLLPNSHRSAGFAVLKAPDVPSVLIETGFISNPEEAKLLSSGHFQRNIASAMLEGIDAYFRKMQAVQKP